MARRPDPEVVIERIYETVSHPEAWAGALDVAARLLGADAALLVYGNFAVGRPTVVEATGFEPAVLDTYVGSHLENDEIIRESMSGPEGLIVSSRDEPRRRTFRESTIYRRLLRPCGLRHLAGSAVINAPKVHSSLWMGRSGSGFSAGDLRQLSALVPHVARAMAVHHRLQIAEMQVDLATGAFDRVALGVVLLDVAGDPILANREAERIAAQRDGFVIGDRWLAADTPSESKRLQALIRQVGRPDAARERVGRESGGAVRITRSSGRADYHVVVMPLPRRCQPGDGSGAVAVVFITDPERTQGPLDYLFGELYDLTEAEARLVSKLLEGCGLTAAAERLGLSRNTVHSQLASVFQKTGTRRQSELLRLLLGGVAPVEAPDASSGFHLPASNPENLTN